MVSAQTLLVWLLCVAGGAWTGQGVRPQTDSTKGAWLRSFPTEGLELDTIGENRYFVLKPGYQLTFRDQKAKNPGTLVITVLNETKSVGGITARVVEERETSDGELIEVSRNYFAIDKKTNDVYYLGEDVDMYKKGKVVGHDGSWLHGTKKARLGLMMPGKPVMGARYYQEQAEGVAMDRAEIVSVSDTLTTQAGVFTSCLKTRETSPLEPLLRDYKMYAPGVGLIKDGDMVLVSHKYVK